MRRLEVDGLTVVEHGPNSSSLNNLVTLVGLLVYML
jgi:hypothetical protein